MTTVLPADDDTLRGLDLAGLAERWAASAAASPIPAEAMTGADRRAQALGVPGERLMEHAGTAVGAAARALAIATGRADSGPVLVLCGPGNNGGDGLVAARWLGRAGIASIVVLVAPGARPTTPDAQRNWDRLDRVAEVRRMHAATPRDLHILERGIERTAVVVDALLGTGVSGSLREPIRSAVLLCRTARSAGVPILAVDTPTGVDLTSGELTDPAVRADLTVTFHRPKTGLLTKRGRAMSGKVLVAPIGIPREADHD
jgi:NAD(P)H-hydrate epimerase